MGPFLNFQNKINLAEKMIYYNKILVAMGPLFHNKNKPSDNYIKSQDVIYYLSKNKFYSVFLINCLKDIFEYIKMNYKDIKKLITKKELKK